MIFNYNFNRTEFTINISKYDFQKKIERIHKKLEELITKPGNKSVSMAKWLSIFIPGAGQIYSGNILSGINAFALNSLNSYFLWYTFDKKNYRDSILIFSLIWLRYYEGNISKAESYASDANILYRQNAVNQIYQDILKISTLYKDHEFEIEIDFNSEQPNFIDTELKSVN